MKVKLTVLFFLFLVLGACSMLPGPPEREAEKSEATREAKEPEAAKAEETEGRVIEKEHLIRLPGGLEDVLQYRQRPMEPVVRNVPKEIRRGMRRKPVEYMKPLVRHLTGHTDDPFLQIKSIHDWICDNIAYDTEGFFSGDIRSTAYRDVLQEGTAVCSGYANLFATMSKMAGFEVYSISGASKGYGYSLFTEEEYESSHAWNAVRIQESWYLVDCTWDAGHVRGRDFEKRYSTGYLFIPPEGMIYTHYPEEERWQLIEPALSYAQYRRLPELRGEFFTFLTVGKDGTAAREVAGTAAVTFGKRRPVAVQAQVVSEDGKEIEHGAFVDDTAEQASIHLALPAPGRYAVRMFARDGDGYAFLGRLRIDATEGTDVNLPLVYSNYIKKGFRLLEPRRKYLRRGEANSVALYAPGWTRAYLKAGDEKFPMQRDDEETFVLQNFKAPEGPVTIYGSPRSRGRTQGALKLYVH